MRLDLLTKLAAFAVTCFFGAAGALLLTGPKQAEAAALQSGSARTCTLYQHRDYGGSRYTLRNGDYLIMINEPDIGTSDGIFRRRYNSSWNDQVSSFRVGRGCTLTMFQHVNRGGARLRSSRSVSYVGSGWNDQASEAICDCGGLPNF